MASLDIASTLTPQPTLLVVPLVERELCWRRAAVLELDRTWLVLFVILLLGVGFIRSVVAQVGGRKQA